MNTFAMQRQLDETGRLENVPGLLSVDLPLFLDRPNARLSGLKLNSYHGGTALVVGHSRLRQDGTPVVYMSPEEVTRAEVRNCELGYVPRAVALREESRQWGWRGVVDVAVERADSHLRVRDDLAKDVAGVDPGSRPGNNRGGDPVRRGGLPPGPGG